MIWKTQNSEAVQLLQRLLSRYRTDNLVNQTRQQFRNRLEGFLGIINWEMEGFKSPEMQRDLSIKFHWGHDHDFGDFFLKGQMGERHIDILAAFMEDFHAIPTVLDGMRILDIGCWTGGTSLLLCAMGAQVVAIDEVKKYVEALKYLKHAFSIDNLEPLHLSMFDCANKSEFQNRFDCVLFAGVLYHVTDPIVALRITLDSLKDNGTLLLESAAVDAPGKILVYHGPKVYGSGSSQDFSRSGWNWFVPSPSCLSQMLEDVGFADIRISDVNDSRILAVGTRRAYVDILRAGLSKRTIE